MRDIRKRYGILIFTNRSGLSRATAAAEAKLSRLEQQHQDEQPFTINELNWFSRNSYNLALKFCTEWEPGQLLRIVQACIQVWQEMILWRPPLTLPAHRSVSHWHRCPNYG